MSNADELFIAPTDEDAILYHQVWRALQNGSSTRPAVPPKILLHIVAFCGWVLPDHVITENSTVICHSFAGHKSEKRWFASAPLADDDLGRIAAIQLVTVGRDQGWADSPGAGSWSWFEIGVERPDGSLVPDVRWKSHNNELCSRKPTMRAGPLYPAPVEEWHVGDVVSVWACAQFPGWSTMGKAGELRLYRWFEPVIPLSTTEDAAGDGEKHVEPTEPKELKTAFFKLALRSRL